MGFGRPAAEGIESIRPAKSQVVHIPDSDYMGGLNGVLHMNGLLCPILISRKGPLRVTEQRQAEGSEYGHSKESESFHI
jgi:hypothetical protein